MELNQIEIFIFAIVWAAGFGIIIWLFYRRKKKRDKDENVHEGRPRKDHRDLDLISDVLPFGRL